MGKFHDDGTLEIGGFGGEEIAEEYSMVREIDVLKKKYERLERECQRLRKANQILKEEFENHKNYVRAIDRNESQLRAKLMFTSRCFVITNVALLVSIIGLLVHAITNN